MNFVQIILFHCILLFVQVTSVANYNSAYVQQKCSTPLPYAALKSGFCAFKWADNLGAPRGIRTVINNDVLVVEQSQSRISVLWEKNGVVQRSVLASVSGLNHALIVHSGYLYASTDSRVYRWRYVPGNRTNLGTPEVVVHSIPSGGHWTRSLEIDSYGRLYVQCGSASNVDSDSSRSQIRRFILRNKPASGFSWSSGAVFADGLRNEVGIRLDPQGRLWGVENGCDNLIRADLGGDIHNDNPSEEMNLFAQSGKFYGYPYCWSVGKLNSIPKGTQYVHPNFMGTYSDAWCQNKSNVVPPAYNFQAHMAPLDIFFYQGTTFPNMTGDAFVAFHGSWNRSPAAGYKVVHVKFQNGMPVSDSPFLYHVGPGETSLNWPHRPVSIAKYKCGGTTECLLVTSDASGTIIAIVAVL